MRALIVDKNADGQTHASVQEIDESRLPEGNVTVAVDYSTVNYKDGLAITGKGPVVYVRAASLRWGKNRATAPLPVPCFCFRP